jgi:hypothetical protein
MSMPAANTMIMPTVGRVVLYHPPESERIAGQPNDMPLAAIVAYVWSARMINVVAITPNGTPYGVTSVQLVQDADATPTARYCTWMPYQIGQAKKTEEAEAKLNAQRLSDHSAVAVSA